MSDRSSKDTPTGLAAYFKAINEIFALQTRVLTGALPHYAERGRNDEQRVVKILEQILPRRYSLGTGFIISSHPDMPASSQIDIVIHDEFFNSPLFRELAANIFPIESVYATVEVKADLTTDKLREAAKALTTIRNMAKRGKYYTLRASPGRSHDGLLPQGRQATVVSPLSPRGFIVGYDAAAATPASFIERLTSICGEHPAAFFHGIYAIKQDWFFAQSYGAVSFSCFDTNGLLTFASKLISSLVSYDMFPMAFSRYSETERLKVLTQAAEAEKDPLNEGWVRAWGVLREQPWHLDSAHKTPEEAENRRQHLGGDYRVAYGSHRLDTDDFMSG